MKRLCVYAEGRGGGLGRDLVDTLIEVAERIGYREMRLDTLPSMAEARGLYRKLGFEVIEPYYDTPVAGTLFMRRRLEPVLDQVASRKKQPPSPFPLPPVGREG